MTELGICGYFQFLHNGNAFYGMFNRLGVMNDFLFGCMNLTWGRLF